MPSTYSFGGIAPNNFNWDRDPWFAGDVSSFSQNYPFGHRSSDAVAWERFRDIDANGDGLVGIEEAIGYGVARNGMDEMDMKSNMTWWKRMDKDGDGYLKPFEFDRTLR